MALEAHTAMADAMIETMIKVIKITFHTGLLFSFIRDGCCLRVSS